MHLGISTFSFAWSVGVPGYPPSQPLALSGLISLASLLDVRCLQIGDNLPLHELSVDELEEAKELLKHANLRVEIGARGLDEEHLLRYLDLCALLGAPLLRFVIDRSSYEPEAASVSALIRKHSSEISRANVVLGIENHDRFTATELARLVEDCRSERVGICLDTANSLGAGEGLESVLEILAPYTFNLHLKDFTIQRLHHNMGFTVAGVPAGHGMMRAPWILEKLKKFDRCQSVILEQWVPFQGSIDETVRLERAWATESVTYLKSLTSFE